MFLPFFDRDSSARYLADLIADADPPMQSLSLIGPRAADLAPRVKSLRPDLSVNVGDTAADVVVSFDAIHLLPASTRTKAVQGIAALAGREIIIACPLGTDLQLTIMRSLVKLAREHGVPVPDDLNLPLQHGLPTPPDAAGWAHGVSDLDLFYAGDVAFFQDCATRHLAGAALPAWRRTLLKFAAPDVTSVAEQPLSPETVPMRRHRRLFLILRKR